MCQHKRKKESPVLELQVGIEVIGSNGARGFTASDVYWLWRWQPPIALTSKTS